MKTFKQLVANINEISASQELMMARRGTTQRNMNRAGGKGGAAGAARGQAAVQAGLTSSQLRQLETRAKGRGRIPANQANQIVKSLFGN